MRSVNIKELDDLWMDCSHGVDAIDIERIWNMAISKAAELVKSKYDELEPWIEPSDIESLYIKADSFRGVE